MMHIKNTGNKNIIHVLIKSYYFTSIWGDGEQMSSPPVRTNGHPSTVMAETHVNHLSKRRIQS